VKALGQTSAKGEHREASPEQNAAEAVKTLLLADYIQANKYVRDIIHYCDKEYLSIQPLYYPSKSITNLHFN
jgi:hypothetical protein